VDPVDRATVQRVAKVARLRLSEEELERYAQDLEEILNSFDVLDQAPSRDSFSFNPVPIDDVMREDEVGCDIDPEKLIGPMDTYDGYVRGPKLS
jgi:aspartyl-tRNA(Asn)/glutamyl-tRNA(Gln) amidotransferase subunit C